MKEKHTRYKKRYLEENIKINGIFKLLPHLNDKSYYILHYKETLRQAAHHGLKITKLNRILKFDQTAWLKVI